MRLGHVAAFSLAFGLCSLAHATSLSYTFNTYGDDPEYGQNDSLGSGALTLNAVPGGASVLSAFTYSLTTSASGLPTASTTFGLGDVSGFESTVDGTSTAPVLESFSLSGAPGNGAFFNLNFNGPSPGPSNGQPLEAYYAAGVGYPEIGSEGNVVYTLVSDAAGGATVTPEPSSFVLLGTGLLGVAGVARRRVSQA